MSKTAYISLGSNLGDREAYLKKAFGLLTANPKLRLTAISSIYETDPVGYTQQGRFLNMVAAIQTELDGSTLLNVLIAIEDSLGRKREIRWGPRTLDLDILLYSNEKINLPRLQVPHPRLFERAFVLVPLKEIYPYDEIDGRNIEKLVEKCSDKDGLVLYKRLSIDMFGSWIDRRL